MIMRTDVRTCASSSEQAVDFAAFTEYVTTTQQGIIAAAEQLEGSGKRFMRDRWERDAGDPNAGWGSTCVLEGGSLLEKAAVNSTVVRGILSPARAQAMCSRGREGIDSRGGQAYAAAAMSLVFHSAHPHIPTLRADVRLFQVAGISWFGGGCDLTPFYIDEADASNFHSFWKAVCDKHQEGLYSTLKQECDKYFYLPARGEHRGIGGLFFDDMEKGTEGASSKGGFDAEAFTRDVGKGILDSWVPIAEKHRHSKFSEKEREWQLLRRGRYLEFNLLYDRGVRFGLDGGRMESIMVSAPPLIAWKYNAIPEPGSREEQLVDVLKKPRDWC